MAHCAECPEPLLTNRNKNITHSHQPKGRRVGFVLMRRKVGKNRILSFGTRIFPSGTFAARAKQTLPSIPMV